MPDQIHVPADLVEVIDSASARLGDPSFLSQLAPEELVALLDQVADVKKVLGDVEGEAKRLIAASMDDDEQRFGDYLVKRSRRRTETWDGSRARSQAKSAIVRRLATDPMTGEVHQPLKRVAEEAVDLSFGLSSTAPKAKLSPVALRGLSLDANDFREYADGELTVSYKVVPE